jgi:hypothetical protein
MKTRDLKDTTGTIALWETAPDFALDALKATFKAAGVEKAAPRARTPLAALKAAVHALYGVRTGQRIAPLGDGYAVLTEHVDADARTVSTVQGLTVWLDDKGRLALSQEELRADVSRAWEKAKTEVDGATVSAALVEACEALGGVPLRKSGGVYWLPAFAVAQWAALAKGVEAASASGRARCYSVRTSGDPDSVRAIADSFVREAEALAAAVEEEIVTGEATGKAALNRAAKMADLMALAEKYEDVLGTALTAVKTRIEATQSRAADTALLALDL